LLSFSFPDSDQPNARLIGIEYIVSERIFETLPEEEKRFWHSHAYEVSSGALIAPRVPGVAELGDMQKLAGTYGKTWHTWQIDRGDALPLGEQHEVIWLLDFSFTLVWPARATLCGVGLFAAISMATSDRLRWSVFRRASENGFLSCMQDLLS